MTKRRDKSKRRQNDQPCNFPTDIKIRKALDQTLERRTGLGREGLVRFLSSYSRCPLYLADYSQIDFVGESVRNEQLEQFQLPSASLLLGFPLFKEACLLGPDRIPADVITFVSEEGIDEDTYYVEVLMDRQDVFPYMSDEFKGLSEESGIPLDIVRSYHFGSEAVPYVSFMMVIDREEPALRIIPNVAASSDCSSRKKYIATALSSIPVFVCLDLDECDFPKSRFCKGSFARMEAWGNWVVRAMDAVRRRSGRVKQCKRDEQSPADPFYQPMEMEQEILDFMKAKISDRVEWMETHNSAKCPLGAWHLSRTTGTFGEVNLSAASDIADAREILVKKAADTDVQALVVVSSLLATGYSSLLVVSAATRTAARAFMADIQSKKGRVHISRLRIMDNLADRLAQVMWR